MAQSFLPNLLIEADEEAARNGQHRASNEARLLSHKGNPIVRFGYPVLVFLILRTLFGQERLDTPSLTR